VVIDQNPNGSPDAQRAVVHVLDDPQVHGRAGRGYGMVVGVAGRVNSLAGTLVE